MKQKILLVKENKLDNHDKNEKELLNHFSSKYAHL